MIFQSLTNILHFNAILFLFQASLNSIQTILFNNTNSRSCIQTHIHPIMNKNLINKLTIKTNSPKAVSNKARRSPKTEIRTNDFMAILSTIKQNKRTLSTREMVSITIHYSLSTISSIDSLTL